MSSRSWRVAVTVPILLAITLLNTFDRVIAPAVNELLRREWSLEDRELGVLFSSFLVVYAVAAVPMGRLVDVVSRRTILIVGVFVWSLLTAAAGFAPTFSALVAVRCGVGIGEAVFFPAVVSLLGDLYPTERRGRALSVVMLGVPLGVASGFAFGGAAAQRYGWRTTFFLTLVPGLLCSLAAFALPEPARGAAERTWSDGPPPAWSALARTRTLWVVTAAAVLNSFATFGLAAFLMPLLMRYHHVPLAEAGRSVAAVTGVGPVVGLLAGGWIVDRLSAHRRDAAMLVSAVTITLAAPLFTAALRMAPEASGAALVLLGLAHWALFPFWALQQVIVQEVIGPRARGRAVATVNFFGMAIGGSLGPVCTGALSDALRRGLARSGAGDAIARAEATQSAMLIAPIALALMALVLFAGLGSMRRESSAWERLA